MKKLIRGIVEFRHNVLEGYKETFAKLALGHKPDVLFIACSDSRVVPNLFASTNPGDLFVLRNIGNLIPPCEFKATTKSDESVAAAVEFSLLNLHVSNIIVCGHSECAAMMAITSGRRATKSPNLRNWLRHGEEARKRLKSGASFIMDQTLSPYNQVSQLNVLLQMEHIKSYPSVQKQLKAGKLNIHGWWFDIAKADVYTFDEDFNKFVLIDDVEAEKILSKLEA